MTRAYYDKRPSAFEAVGNGNWLYRWDIQEEVIEREPDMGSVTQYSCNEATIHGKPEYGNCVEAVIRSDYSTEAEFSLINQYNAYQQGISSNASVVSEYEKYLAYVSSVKAMVKKDFDIEPDVQQNASIPRMADIARLLTLTVNTMSLTDDEALSVKSVYPQWSEFINKKLTQGMKVQYGNKLYKVLQQHTASIEWKPDETPSLFGLLSEHEGTMEDPIPYERMMVLEKGKYYTQYGVTYKCVTGSITGYDADLTELMSLLEVVSQEGGAE